jgi:hypothetical protein
MLFVPASATAGWEETQLPGAAGKVYLLGVDCPSKELCVAVGTNNLIASSTNPTEGAGDWKYVHAGEGPWPQTEEWPTEAISGRQIQSISCPSVELCVAVTSQGNIYSSTNPTGPASAWKVSQVDEEGHNTHLFGVSCPSVSLCVAVSGRRLDQGKILTSTDPHGGPSAWSAIELAEPMEFRAVSCDTPSFCAVVTEDGRIVTSTNPRGDGSAWSVLGAPAGPGSLRAVSCVESALCLSGNEGGNLLVSANPTAGLSSWSVTDGGGSVQITGTACAAASECLAVDNNGSVLVSTDPTGGRAAWSYTNLVPYTPGKGMELEGNALFAASCPSSSLCALTGSRGRIFTSTDPFAEVSEPAAAGKGKGKGRAFKRPRAKIATIRIPSRKRIENGTGKAMIRFYAKGRVRGFVCKLDRRPWKRCRSPKRYRVGFGKHLFRVRAIGLTGLKGPVARELFVIHPPCPELQAGGGPALRPKVCSR